jgi:hypothetical protein
VTLDVNVTGTEASGEILPERLVLDRQDES